MKKSLASIAIAVLTLLPTASNAGFMTGKDLLDELNSSDKTSSLIATAYVIGVVDLMDNLGMMCLPRAGIRGNIPIDLTRKVLQENKDMHDQGAERFVVEAMRKAYPCKK